MKQKIEYVVARLFIGFFQLLPLRISARVGEMFGTIFYAVDRRHRQVALSNLKSAFGRQKNEEERERIALASFRNLGRSVAEFARSQRMSKSEVQSWVDVEGFDHYLAANEQKKGVALLSAHFGNWELVPLAFSLYQVQMYVVARALDNPYLNRMTLAWRERNGHRVLNKKTAAGEIIHLLRKGATVGFLLDQNTAKKEAVFVDYFGMPAATHKGLAVIALRTGTPVLPTFLIRKERGYQLIIEKPLEPVKTGDLQTDIQETTALFTQKIESYVRQYPDHWFWLHQRWKTKKD
jgi:KDO2-lipid IV(A) lauroyltransferase